MTPSIRLEYSRLRAIGFHSREALRAASTNDAFQRAEYTDGDPEYPGLYVRLRVKCEQECYDDSYIDTWTDQSESQRKHARKALWERIEREGVFYIVGEYWDGAEWQQADSVCGFVGDDWKDSGYDVDVKQSALDAAEELYDSVMMAQEQEHNYNASIGASLR